MQNKWNDLLEEYLKKLIPNLTKGVKIFTKFLFKKN